MHKYNGKYTKDNLRHIAFPLGGIGAGMFCIQGSGMLGNFSLRNEPDLHKEPNVFSAVCIKSDNGNIAKVIEGQVPYYKIFGGSGKGNLGMGNGLYGKNYGLPRFRDNDFTARFPFAHLNFYDEMMPLDVSVTGWSPFTPPDADSSSSPTAALEYRFENNTEKKIDAVYSFSSVNFLKDEASREAEGECIYAMNKGFMLYQPPKENEPHIKAWFYVTADEENVNIDTDWFDGGWFDVLTMRWNDIQAGIIKNAHNPGDKSPGGSIIVPFTLEPGGKKTIRLKFAWYVPNSNLRNGYEDDSKAEGCFNNDSGKAFHKPWYSMRYKSVDEVMEYFTANYDSLRELSKNFSDAFYESSLPEEVLEAVSANLSIFKSPTVLRQTDGRLWCWEGCCDSEGSCSGSCTHVWNYAQAFCHLFPELERTFRKTEFNECQNEKGHQQFRAPLPIGNSKHDFFAASDGQLGGIMKMYREWRISGDTKWLAGFWDKIKSSLDYCIDKWDKKREGVLKEPHHNTYDIEFWGADSMCSSFYLGALKAICLIGKELGKDIDEYDRLYKKGKEYLETKLFNGEYFYQEVEWETLDEGFDVTKENANAQKLLIKEGPKYQYGTGCLSDGIIGAWLAKICGLGNILDAEKIKSHLLSVYRYNYRKSLLAHANPQRPGFAIGDEGGLLLCTWPRGNKPSLPFIYSDEVWTGIEYQVASYLMMMGFQKEGLEIVSTLRDRYDGTKRNPFDEYECGHWYARAMASYAFIEAMTGVRYDAVDRTLYIRDGIEDGTKSFLCTQTGYGTVKTTGSNTEVAVCYGEIDIKEIIRLRKH